MLSEHVVEQDVAMLPAAVDGEREDRPSDRYVVAARRDGEEDGLRLAVPAGALVPRVTYRVSGWVAVQVQGGGDCDGDGERSHVVRVSLCLDDCGVEGECRRIDCGAVCTGVAGGWVEINGTFRLNETPRGTTAGHVHGAPAGVDVKVMDLRVFAEDRKARFRQLKDKTDKVRYRIDRATHTASLALHDHILLLFSRQFANFVGKLSSYLAIFVWDCMHAFTSVN